MAQKIAKARYWTAVLYPECMVDNWEDNISDLVQVPFVYCIHDKDKCLDDEEERKVHIHVVLAFPNTTTYKHALSIFQKLQDNIQYCEQVLNIRYIYNYLIHDTDSCKKKNKHIYDITERITGNGFDIGSYEQISIADKRKMLKELCDIIKDKGIYNFTDFYSHVILLDDSYFDVFSSYSGLLERLCKGNYLKMCK